MTDIDKPFFLCYKLNMHFILIINISIHIITFILVGFSEADIVRYIDENGKQHVVNTEYVRVPVEYLPQVQGQLQKTAEDNGEDSRKRKDGNSESEDSDEMRAPLNEYGGYLGERIGRDEANIKIYLSSGCKKCDQLEGFLKENNIEYIRSDVDSDPHARQVLQSSGGRLPLVTVNASTPASRYLKEIIAIMNGSGAAIGKCEVFISADCEECIQIEKVLNNNRIRCAQYDIHSDVYGNKVVNLMDYEEDELPLIKLDSLYISEINTDQILEIFNILGGIK